ncbi:MAG: leucine-rich repeat domain-containing protein [Ruminococcus sp.]
MKKITLCFILGAVMAAGVFSSVPVSAEDNEKEYENLNYTISEEGTAVITNCFQNATECTVPEEIDGAPVTKIADSAFSECYFLETLTIPDSVKIIGRQAFSACSQLKTIKLPKEVEKMGAGAFDGCAVLESVVMPKGITELPEASFYECTGLKTVTLQEGLEIIGSESFYGCTSLSEIVFPSSLTSINDYAFQDCQSLKKIIFPENVQNLGKYIFQGCKSLEAIETDENNPMFMDKDGVLFTKDGVTLIRYPQAKKNDSFAVPEGCSQLAAGSFTDAVHLKNIDMGNATTYGMDVFFRCTALESIALPEGTTDISPSMFAYCSSMKSISFPSTLKNIGDYAFYTCAALTEVTVPEGTEKLGAYSFFNCIELKTLRLPDSITEIGDGAMGYFAEADDQEPEKLDGFTVEYGTNDVIHSFAEKYELEGTGSGKSSLYIWIISIAGALVLIGGIVAFVILRRRAYIPRPVPGGRTGSATKRPEPKKKG